MRGIDARPNGFGALILSRSQKSASARPALSAMACLGTAGPRNRRTRLSCGALHTSIHRQT